MARERRPTWPASSRIGESRADFEARIRGQSLGEQSHDPAHCDRNGQPHLGPCIEPAPPLACADHLVIGCECQGPQVPEPEPKRGRGRPRVGAPVIVRLHPFQRAQIESAGREGEALAATIRRLIGEALAARQLTKDR